LAELVAKAASPLYVTVTLRSPVPVKMMEQLPDGAATVHFSLSLAFTSMVPVGVPGELEVTPTVKVTG